MKKEIYNSRIMVTGGSGFIGTNLISYLGVDSRNNEIISLDIKSPKDITQMNYWRRVDLLDKKMLGQIIQEFDPDYIFHMAARTDLHGQSIEEYRVNTEGVSNLIESIKGAGRLKKVIFASSRLVCRIGYLPKNEYDYCPTTAYGKSKVEGEKIIRRMDKYIPSQWVIVRPTSIWGPWFDIPYRNFFDAVRSRIYFHPYGINIRKSFGYVGNSIYQLECIAVAPASSVNKETFYLCDYPPIEVGRLADSIAASFNQKKPIRVPMSFLRTAAIIGDILKKIGIKEPPLTSFRLNNLQTEMIYDTTELERVCGHLPFKTEEGIQSTVDWINDKSIHCNELSSDKKNKK